MGNHGSPFTKILEPKDWLWRVTWHNGKAYGVSYRSEDDERTAALFESIDGINYNKIVTWDIFGHPTKTTLRFLETDEMIALVRRDEVGNRNAYVGISSPPYNEWEWILVICILEVQIFSLFKMS